MGICIAPIICHILLCLLTSVNWKRCVIFEWTMNDAVHIHLFRFNSDEWKANEKDGTRMNFICGTHNSKRLCEKEVPLCMRWCANCLFEHCIVCEISEGKLSINIKYWWRKQLLKNKPPTIVSFTFATIWCRILYVVQIEQQNKKICCKLFGCASTMSVYVKVGYYLFQCFKLCLCHNEGLKFRSASSLSNVAHK